MCVVAGGGGMPAREDRAGCWGGPKGQFKGPQFHTATKSPREKSASEGFGHKRSGLGGNSEVLIPAPSLTNFGTISLNPDSSHLSNGDKNVLNFNR